MKYLGHIISNRGIQVDEMKTKTILDMKTATNKQNKMKQLF